MKRINSCILSSLLLALLCIGAQSPSVEVKLRPAPHKVGDIAADSDWSILPRLDVYEVGASKLDVASIRDLPPSGFRALKEPEAIEFTGAYYSCPSGKRPYLIRAVYAKGGFGRFRAERRGSSLAIIWGDPLALQIARSGNQSSAVVVNLDFTPDEIYTEFSSVD
jgi:hypothetical protein